MAAVTSTPTKGVLDIKGQNFKCLSLLYSPSTTSSPQVIFFSIPLTVLLVFVLFPPLANISCKWSLEGRALDTVLRSRAKLVKYDIPSAMLVALL